MWLISYSSCFYYISEDASRPYLDLVDWSTTSTISTQRESDLISIIELRFSFRMWILIELREPNAIQQCYINLPIVVRIQLFLKMVKIIRLCPKLTEIQYEPCLASTRWGKHIYNHNYSAIMNTAKLHGECIYQVRVHVGCWCARPGGRLNKKDGLTRYGNSHVKDKTS